VTESVVLTCLPNGIGPDGARVTVFVTPRLTHNGGQPAPLGDFPAFATWPATVQTLGEGAIAVLIEKAGSPAGTPPDKFGVTAQVPSPIDLDLWKRLFDPVKVGVFPTNPGAGDPAAGFQDLSGRTVRSFPASSVAQQIASLYNDVAATSPTSFPSVTDPVLAGLEPLGVVSLDPRSKYAEIDKSIGKDQQAGIEGGGYYRPTGSMTTAERNLMAFVQARRFYDRPGKIVDSPKGKPPIDFHGYVSFLGDYPLLLRKLGLAIDLVLDAFPPDQGRIRLLVEPVPNGLEFTGKEAARPWTNYEIQDRRFIAKPRNPEGVLVDGSLRLESDWFDVQQLDVDGSALKTFDFAGTVKKITDAVATGQPSMTPEETALPALRTGGFVIIQWERDKAVVGQLGEAAKHEADRAADVPADLFAEDVTRGTRPHVQHLTGSSPWRSLNSRDGTYAIVANGAEDQVLAAADEGFVKGASATSALDENDDDLYLHEAVFGWDGWSLVVKRPGQAIIDSGGHDVDLPQPGNDPDFPLVTRFTVPTGTLPRLRFGQTYRFRAQAVDLAGNSVEAADLVDHLTRDHTFRRWDPIPSPAIIPRRRFTEGESLTRLVIRSTLGAPPAAYVAQARIQGLAGHTKPTTAYLVENRRWLAPPKSSVQLAEWHSMLDFGIGQAPNDQQVDAAFDVAARESGSYIDPGPGAEIVSNDPAATPTNLSQHTKGDALKPGEYVIRDTNDLSMPYLPDPASEGASFTTLPGAAGTLTYPWRGASWPDRLPIELRIVDGGLTTDAPTAPKPDSNVEPKIITVALRQADMVVVRLSSFPTKEGVGVSAILAPLAPLGATQQADVATGRNWLVTPYEEITLVHAVEKPLAPPLVNVVDAGVQRYEGETFAALTGTIDNHAKSTGRLDIDATWTEPIDDPLKEAPEDADNLGEVHGQGHAGDFQLEAIEDACRTGRDDVLPTATTAAVHKVRHEFRDTKHRRVTYQAKATTRFREYFPPEITNDPNLITHLGPPTTVSIPSSRRPDPPDVEYVIPTFRWTDDVFPGLPAGTTIEDLEPTIARALGGVRGARGLLERGLRADRISLPSRIRLPLIRRRVRKAGLRVYLGRPWYSSGADELLAVVLPDQPYLLWPIDVGNGLIVDAMAKALADDAAEHLLGRGILRDPGGERQRPSDRLARSLRAMTAPATDPLEAMPVAEAALTDFQITRAGDALVDLPGTFFPFPAQGDPEKFVTRYGADPIWASDPPATGPWIHQFPLRTRVATGLTLAEAPAWTVAAVGHRPRFDKDRDLWYCDIDINAGTSYFPFVRLGLARYQPSSIPGVHLSRVVTPEWAQLMPNRTATLGRPRPDAARVTLRGPAGYSSVATSVLGQAAGSAAGLGLSRFAVAQVERRPASAKTDLAWQPAGPEVRLDLAVRTAYSDIEYSGTIEVPGAAEGGALRVTLREYEVLETDASQADQTLIVPGSIDPSGPFGFPGSITLPSAKPVRFRLVYASHLAL
jgi:hypothetical protein